MNHHIQVGFGRIDIMPQGPIELGGLGNGHMRVSETILDPLQATCIAITDEQDQTLLLITMDLLHAKADMVAAIRAEITKQTGIPGDHIMVAASHTHSGPDIGNPVPQRVQDYIRYVNQRVPLAALAALEDRSSAQVFSAQSWLERMNFVRHYWRADGKVARPTKELPVLCHTTQADGRLRLLQFKREEGEDILLMSWPAHSTFTGKSYSKEISADYIAPVRSYVEMAADCHFAFFQGACGNLVGNSLLESDHSTKDFIQYGRRLGEEVMALMDRMQPVRTGPLQFVQRPFRGRINHTQDHRVEEAKKVWDFWLGNGKIPESWPVAQAAGFNTPYMARAIITRAGLGEAEEMELDAVRLGELAFATAPCEMFDSCGAHVKDSSPFPVTVMLAYCNGSNGYFPTRRAFAYGCYEADTCRYEPGAAEEMADTLVDMLDELNR